MTCFTFVVLVICSLVMVHSTTVTAIGVNPCFDHTFGCTGGNCPSNCDSVMYNCNVGKNNGSLTCTHVLIFTGRNIGLDIGLLLLLPVFLAISSAAGIGGGGFIPPFLMIISQFSTYYAVPLSATTIVGGSLSAFFIIVRLKHPDPNANGRPLIAYDLILVLLPGALAGTVLGVLINAVSPNWLTNVVILLVLIWSSIRTWKKAIQMRRLEREHAKIVVRRGMVGRSASPSGSETLAGSGRSTSTAGLEVIELTDFDTASILNNSTVNPGGGQEDTVTDMIEAVESEVSLQYGNGNPRPPLLPTHSAIRAEDSRHNEDGHVVFVEAAVSPSEIDEIPNSSSQKTGEQAHHGVMDGAQSSQQKKSIHPPPPPQPHHLPRIITDTVFPNNGTTRSESMQQPPSVTQIRMYHGKLYTKVMLREKLQAEEAKFPWFYLAVCLVYLIGLIPCNIAKGIAVKCGSGQFWAVVAAAFGYMMLCTGFGVWFVRRKMKLKFWCEFPLVMGDLDLSNKQVLVYSCFAVGAGILAGYTGIGGGMILGPMLLNLGLLPLVSSPTSLILTLFTSISNGSQYLVQNRIPWSYGVALFGLGILSSLFGQSFILGYAKRTGKNSVLVLAVLFILVVSVILLATTAIMTIVSDVNRGDKNFGFTSLCG